MTIAATGPVSLQDVQNEFGGAAPIGINEYYEGAPSGYVTATNYDPASQIPSSGPISLQDFRGVTRSTAFIFNDTVTASTTAGYSLAPRAVAAGWDEVLPLVATVTINSGVTITAPASWDGAFTTLRLAAYPAGSSLTLYNNGTIAGLGGAGGVGGAVTDTATSPGGAGGNGHTGLFVSGITVNLYNNSATGVIGGGGGGGGGGGAAGAFAEFTDEFGSASGTWSHSGGGGGGGRAFGAAGNGGVATVTVTPGYPGPGNAGVAGTYAVPGAGGAPFPQQTMVSGGTIVGGTGGAGGLLGQNGSPGSPGVLTAPYTTGTVSAGGAGGLAGNAVMGGANIVWYSLGSIAGDLDSLGDRTNIPGDVVQNNAYEVSASSVQPFQISTTAYLVLNPDGTTTAQAFASLDFSNTPNWYSPATANIGTNFWVRAIETSSDGSGTTGTSAVGTWLSLASARTFGVARGNSTGSSTRTFIIQIATDAAGTVIVADATLSVTATMDSGV